MENIIYVLIIFIFWLICNTIVRKLIKENLYQEVIISSVKYRKTLFFDVVAIVIFTFLNITFLTWIGIIYYILISIIEGIMLVIALVTNLDFYFKEHIFEKEMWLLVIVKFLNETASIIVALSLFSLLE